MRRPASQQRPCAPQALCPTGQAPRTVETMGATRQALCAGRGDGSDCPNGEVLTVEDGAAEVRCEECRHYWELDETEPGRRPVVDDGLTRPLGDPREAGHGTAA
ncbi:sle1_094 (plasmid) [Streptomyces leeuwenhoekii]|uniref:Sle1_094 protein n=1 Tax=Streptomyces leeuwenhoekii TaxID=1437453 RepID=A0A0F7VR33_STRLW|nr:sle1_094 [Streptomyces leeuwenhoekii]